jgi:two-component system invasion response regulator UvrY
LYPTRIQGVNIQQRSCFDGVLSKDADVEEIFQAIKTVHRGISYISPVLAEKIFNQKSPNTEISKLNEQEIKIFFYLSKGKTNTEIAQEMFLSSRTVKTYVSKILHKLNLPNRAAAAVSAAKVFENGFLW